MATTYLTLANEALRELNEVTLTASNFSSAVGIQAFVKEAINRSLNDIANAEPQLPFFAVATDFASIDWDDFYITTIGVSGEEAPFVSRGLRFISLGDWRRYVRDSENADDAKGSDASHGEPRFVIRSPDHRKFGLSPIPDKVYNVHFYAYSKPTELSSFDDAIVLPDQYASIVLARTRYYIHQFKENMQQAAFALDDYRRGMKSMKSNLINPQPKSMSDDRIYF